MGELHNVVNHGESSQLKTEICRGIASLCSAKESWLRPHACLNGLKGIKAIDEIVKNPDSAGMAIWLEEEVVYGGGHDGMWLNAKFCISLEDSGFDCFAHLSPRQTSFIIQNLSKEPQKEVVEKIKSWYILKVLPEIEAAIGRISNQVASGDLLIADCQRNRVLDIHDKWHEDTPYSEGYVAGLELFWNMASQCYRQFNSDMYEAADSLMR